MSDDLIRRSDAIEALRKRWAMTVSYNGIGEDIGEECAEAIETAPTVNSSEWIPCSVRMPLQSQEVLVSHCGIVEICRFLIEDEPIPMWGCGSFDVAVQGSDAWMLLPKPYEEKS